jgi:hypothetical protein
MTGAGAAISSSARRVVKFVTGPAYAPQFEPGHPTLTNP